jgi:hypothetical protein
MLNSAQAQAAAQQKGKVTNKTKSAVCGKAAIFAPATILG